MNADGRNDYRVTVKVRNNNILRAIEKTGLRVRAFCNKNGLAYHSVITLIQMRASPLLANGEVRPIVDRLCFALNATLDDLFSEQQREARETTTVEVEMNSGQVAELTNGYAPTAIQHDDGLGEAMAKNIACLTECQQLVIKKRFGLNDEEPMTIVEIADMLEVTPERVRQIEATAIRKLRHPAFDVGGVRDFVASLT